jgi:glucosamine--fructose-6-phosphate aminotransferase (isomerizing)
MCGIVGVVGAPSSGDLGEVILSALERLEYRGYDSAGIALVDSLGEVYRERRADRRASVAELRSLDLPSAAVGIGHVRWATHGRPTVENAHPLVDCSGQLAVVHNGIIENHVELAEALACRGHRFRSETDTEVIAHLVEEGLAEGADLLGAVRQALGVLQGAFALAVMAACAPDRLVAARRVSPLLVGLGDGVGVVGSDVAALIGETRDLAVVEDDQVVEVRAGSLRALDAAAVPVTLAPLRVDWDLAAAKRSGFPDFMSKEIAEQPEAVRQTLLGRALPDGRLRLDEMRLADAELREVDKVIIVACGSSFHAGMVAKYAIEHRARLPVEVDIASEFRYRDPIVDSRTLVVGVSQSGETIDTLQALRAARTWGARVLVISNVVDSSMAREADAVLYTHAGPEIGVAATKTFLAQVVAMELLGLYLAEVRGILFPTELEEPLARLAGLPGIVGEAVERSVEVAKVADALAASRDFFFIGRHVGYPVALEGALKLKEISYLRAEGFPAGELKHGPLALLDEGSVVVAVATRSRLWEKVVANIAEVKARGARVVGVVNDGDERTAELVDHVLSVPRTAPLLTPAVDVVPLQLLAYHLAKRRGLDVDRPRNLAKTVTVE